MHSFEKCRRCILKEKTKVGCFNSKDSHYISERLVGRFSRVEFQIEVNLSSFRILFVVLTDRSQRHASVVISSLRV